MECRATNQFIIYLDINKGQLLCNSIKGRQPINQSADGTKLLNGYSLVDELHIIMQNFFSLSEYVLYLGFHTYPDDFSLHPEVMNTLDSGHTGCLPAGNPGSRSRVR